MEDLALFRKLHKTAIVTIEDE